MNYSFIVPTVTASSKATDQINPILWNEDAKIN